MTVVEPPGVRPDPSLKVAMNKAIKGRLSREEMVEDTNLLAVLVETRGLKVTPAM